MLTGERGSKRGKPAQFAAELASHGQPSLRIPQRESTGPRGTGQVHSLGVSWSLASPMTQSGSEA